MNIGPTANAGISQYQQLNEGDAKTQTFLQGQIVVGKVFQLDAGGASIQIGGRLFTVPATIAMVVGQQVSLFVKEGGRNPSLVPLAAGEDVETGWEHGTVVDLDELLRALAMPADNAHREALRELLSSGRPITRELLHRFSFDASKSPNQTLTQETTDTALARLLESLDLSPDGANIVAARQLLSKGMPVTNSNIQQLTRALAKLGANGEDDYEAAAYLQANRLPITAATLELTKAMLRDPRALGRQIHSLRTAIDTLANALNSNELQGGIFDDTQRLVEQVSKKLSERILLAGEAGRSRFLEGLQKLFKDQGMSLESRIARVLAGSADATDLEGDLRTLLSRLVESVRTMDDEVNSGADLRHATDLLRATAAELSDGLQAQQLRNAAEPESELERWLSFQIPFADGMDDRPRTAELRIASEPGIGIDPNHLRLVLRLELERLKTVEVNIQIAGKRLVCSLASDCESTLPLLHTEFYALRRALEELGYFVTAPSIKQLDGRDLDKGRKVPNELTRVDLRA